MDVNSEGSRDWIEEHVVMLGHVNAGNPRLSVIVNPVLSTGTFLVWVRHGQAGVPEVQLQDA